MLKKMILISVGFLSLLSCQMFSPPVHTGPKSVWDYLGREFTAEHGFRMVEALEPNDNIMVVKVGDKNSAFSMDKTFIADHWYGFYTEGTNIAVLSPHPAYPAFAVSPDRRYITGITYPFAIKRVKNARGYWEEKELEGFDENKLKSSLLIVKELGKKERKVLEILLTDNCRMYTDINHIDWSPDSSRIYFSHVLDDRKGFDHVGPDYDYITSYDIKSGNKEVVYKSIPTIWDFKVSPDGEKLLMREGESVTVYNMRTKERKEVWFKQSPTESGRFLWGNAHHYDWASDSKHFVFHDKQRGLHLTDISNPGKENQKFLFFSTRFGKEFWSRPPACRPNRPEVAFWDEVADGLSIVNYETGELKRGIFYVRQEEWFGGNGALNFLTWSKDGRYLAGNIFIGSGIPGSKGPLFHTPTTPITEHWLFVIDFKNKEGAIFGMSTQYPVPIYFVEDPAIIRQLKEMGYKHNDEEIMRRIEEVRNLWNRLNSKEKVLETGLLRKWLKSYPVTEKVRQEAEAQIQEWEAELKSQSKTPKPK